MSFLQGLFGPPDIEKLKGKGDVEGLIKLLDYQKEATIPPKAAQALGELRDARAVEPLVKLLPEQHMRMAAIEALGKIGDGRAVEPLIAILEMQGAEHANVRKGVMTSLEAIGKPAVIPLIFLLQSGFRPMREVAAQTLGRLGDPRAAEPLAAALRDEHESVQEAAAAALGHLDWQPGASEAGAAYFIYRGEWEKCIEMGEPAVKPIFAAFLEGNQETQKCAIRALIKIGGPAAEPLIAAINGYNPRPVVEMATQTVREIGVEAVEALIATLLKKGDDKVRRQVAAGLLGEIGDLRGIAPLIATLSEGDPNLRETAIQSLIEMSNSQMVEPLIVALGDENLLVREAAAQILGEVGESAAVPALIAALTDDKSEAVREAAARALGGIGDTKAVAPLITALRRETETVRMAAAGALGEIGDSQAVEPLIAILKDTEPWGMRHVAVQALGDITGQKSLGEDAARWRAWWQAHAM